MAEQPLTRSTAYCVRSFRVNGTGTTTGLKLVPLLPPRRVSDELRAMADEALREDEAGMTEPWPEQGEQPE